jgi:hypothetical protein
MSTAVNYIPLNVQISDITRAVNALVTTDSDHYYVVGQLVRFHVPRPYGMQELDEKLAYVLTVPSDTTFTVDVDSSRFTAFITSPTYPGNMAAQVSAVGDGNNTSRTTTSNGLTVSGAFINNTNPNR